MTVDFQRSKRKTTVSDPCEASAGTTVLDAKGGKLSQDRNQAVDLRQVEV
jgi:hypothetical protein